MPFFLLTYQHPCVTLHKVVAVSTFYRRNLHERFVVSITELHRYLQKLKELEMGQMDLKAGYTMCLYYLGKHPEGLTATQLTELCKEDKAAISRTLSQLSSKGLVSCELPEHKRSYRTLYYLTEEGNTVVKKISSRIYSALAHGGDGMTEEQRLNLYDSLERISHNLEQYLTEFSVKHPTEK